MGYCKYEEEIRKRKNKLEFSKLIFISVSAVNIIVIAFTMYMIYITRDLSPLAYLIPSVAGEMAAATGFYYNKAKAENKIKLMKENGIEPDKETFEKIE